MWHIDHRLLRKNIGFAGNMCTEDMRIYQGGFIQDMFHGLTMRVLLTNLFDDIKTECMCFLPYVLYINHHLRCVCMDVT